MTIISEKVRSVGCVEFLLWADAVPEDLLITGADIGRPGTTIAVGSILETPEAQFKMGENGYFLNIETGGGGDKKGINWADLTTANLPDESIVVETEDDDCDITFFSSLFKKKTGYNETLKSVYVDAPYAVSVLFGTGCFQNCKALESVDVKSPTLQFVNHSAFSGCSALKYISLPNLQSIGDAAFGYAGDKLSTEYMPLVQVIGKQAFYQASVEDIIFPEALSIGESAFQNAKDISELVLTKATSFAVNCFKGATFLNTAIELPSAESIGASAFENTNINNILMRSVTSIASAAFAGVSNLSCTIATFSVPSIQANTFPVGTQFYVQPSLVDSYKTATNWAQHAANIHPMP